VKVLKLLDIPPALVAPLAVKALGNYVMLTTDVLDTHAGVGLSQYPVYLPEVRRVIPADESSFI
jgi:hypothetical protein